MESKNKSQEDIDTIKAIMERSTRFLSLSGLSGIFAGLIAIVGSVAAIFLILNGNIDGNFPDLTSGESPNIAQLLFIDGLFILTSAIVVALLLSYRKASLQRVNIWTPVSRRLLVNLAIPLIAGGLFIFLLYDRGIFELIIPSMLIFYGLALVNAGKFTFSEIFYLGILEIITGVTAGLIPFYGIFLWIFGFGFLHIVYGAVMFRKYDR